jgi:hypothetical protein
VNRAQITLISLCTVLIGRVVDPQHFNANPDPDPALYQSYVNLRPLGLQTLQGSILSLHAFIVSVHFEPLKLLNFDFIADPDPDLDPHPLPMHGHPNCPIRKS